MLKGIGQGIGISAFNSIAGAASMAAGSVVDFARDSIGAASDLREALALADQVFESSARTITTWGDTTAESMGTSTAAAVEMAAIFGTQFKAAGLSLDEVASKSIELTELAADLGSAFNRSSEEAATALRSGLLGEAEPMRRFGSNLSEARVKAYLLSKGIQAVGGSFTDGQKIMARYNLILEDTADSQGMFGRDSESFADKQKILQATFENLQATIGTELLPVMVDLATILAEDVVPGVLDAVEGFKNLATAADLSSDMETPDRLTEFANAIGFLNPLLVVNNANMDRLAELEQKAAEQTAEAAEQLDVMRRAAGRGAQATEDLTDATGPATEGIGDVGQTADEAADQLRDMKDALQAAFDTMIENIYDPEQLRLALLRAKDETAQLTAKLRELEAVKKPTAETRRDILDTKLSLSQSREEVDKLAVRIGLLNGATLDDLRAAWKTLLRNGIKPNTAEARQLLRLLNEAEAAARRTAAQIAVGRGPQERAEGGRAEGLTWVGEKGPELVNLPRGSYVHSNAESMRMASSPSGGGGVVGSREIHIHIDQGAYIDGPSIDRLTTLIAQRLNYSTAL